MNYQHKSVLLDEVVGCILPKPDGVYVDATIGSGGHAEEILEKSAPCGKLIGIDIDPCMLGIAEKRLIRFGDRCLFACGNFVNLKHILESFAVKEINGIIFDLGVSTEHFFSSERGFSVLRDGPLDMRLGKDVGITAFTIINKWPSEDLVKILYQYGEEGQARRIIKYIIQERKKKKINTTGELSELITKAVGGRRGKIHPVTKTFQALRIAVNDELNSIKTVLPIAVEMLKEGGRICVVSFHSLEDRIVKNTFRNMAGSSIRIITKKPIVPKREEVISNPRSRSAKLRVAEKIKRVY